MKTSLRSIIALVAICAVMGTLLAITNAITAPIIADNQAAEADKALIEIMPNGTGFEKLDLSGYKLPSSVTDVHKSKEGGYIVTVKTDGYQPGMTVMCGINADGTISGAKCLSSSETLGYEKSYGDHFVGKDEAGAAEIDTISGATKTTEGYKKAIADAFAAKKVLDGESVDFRTEEEILLENLSSALPEGEGKFTKPFITEVIEGIDAVYVAENGAGYVYVLGDAFVAVRDGEAIANETVNTAHAILSATSTTDLDLTAYEGLPKALVSAMKTESGNYILEMKAAGYGINGGNEYHPSSGKYIMILVSLTADGRIIDTMTLSQEESVGFGDACADEKFYGQFDGKTADNYTDIDAISGATMTTNGYLKAIERAFETVTIFEGGASDEE